MYIPSERVEIPKKLISLKNSYDNMSPSKDKNYGDLRNGFQCPDCGKELSDLKNSGILESMPAQKQVVCKCGFQGTRYVTD
jgi:DNA-directed RNA polymerase subunit RPC12/RpoP